MRDIGKKPAVHTVPHGEGWANRTEGASRVFGTAPTKAAAAQIGQDSARSRGTEWMAHRTDGTIGERRSYGGDPHPPKG